MFFFILKRDKVEINYSSIEAFHASISAINMTESIRKKFINLYEKPKIQSALCGVSLRLILWAMIKLFKGC